MNNPAKRLSQNHDATAKVTQIVQSRTKLALEHFTERVKGACEQQVAAVRANPLSAWEIWTSGAQCAVDFAQRSILLLETLRQRGNNFVEHERQGLPPVLRFDYEMVLDGRTLERPVNYALVRIVPPKGVTIDPKRRPSDLLKDYRDLLPGLPRDEARRIGGEQEIIARYEPEMAVETLPVLLARRKDRDRLLVLLERVLADKRVQRIQPSPEQTAMLARIRRVLGRANHRPALAPPRRPIEREVAAQAG
jgi:hypothetical protein